jgi:uncharacterized coiled-coil protein SlyX
MTEITQKKTKLATTYEQYVEQRAAVTEAHKELAVLEDMIAKFTESFGQKEVELEKARRRLRVLADKLPGLIGSDAAGVCGKRPEEPAPPPEPEAKPEAEAAP